MHEELFSRQLGLLIFLYLLGSAIIYVPESIVGQDVWIATILASLPGLIVVHALIRIQEMYPGKNIMQVSVLLFGKVLGTILNLAYIWSLLLIASLVLFDAMVFLKIIYPVTPEVPIAIIVILAACYIVHKGITSVGRLADLAAWLVLFLIISAFLFCLTVFDLYNITPVLIDIKPVLGAAVYGAGWPFTELVVIALLFPYVVDLNTNKKKIYFWFGVGTLVSVVRSFLILGVLGSSYMQISRFPFYDVFRLLQFQEFQRVELFFFVLFFTTVSFAIILNNQALTLAFKQLFNLKNAGALFVPVGFLVLALCYNSFPSDVKFLATQATSASFVILPVTFSYPTIIFLMAKWKNRGQKAEVSSEA